MQLISSIKHKSLALLVSLTIGLTVVYFGLSVVVGFVIEDIIISKLLNKHADYVEQQYQATGELPNLELDFIQVYKEPTAMPKRLYQSIIESTGDREIFTPDKTHYHFKTLNLGETQMGYILAEVSDLLVISQHPSIFIIYFIGLVLALLLAVYLSLKFSKKIVDPIVSLTHSIKNGQIGARTNSLPKFEYELGYLSNTFHKAFSDLTQALEREKNFTTDVGHEIRTPLTILKNQTVLIEQRGFKETDLVEMKSVCLQMENTVSVLLALARAESIHKERCNIKIMLEQAILTNSVNNTSKTNVVLNVDSTLSLKANAALLTLLFNNLIANAFEHAPSHQLNIHQQDDSLIFENNTQNKLPIDATCSGVRSQNSQGVGQGLYLVTRIVESFGWHYQLTQNDNTLCFKILF